MSAAGRDRAPPEQAPEDEPRGGVLSIETGFGCNAYCAFCPQIRYRDDPEPDVPLDLETDELRARIEHGAKKGYRQIGFSGGEVTIRKDLLELVRLAKSLGYERIAITTNGMMLGYMQYAASLVQAGVTNVNVSIFGHEARLHDALMRTPGAFEMAIRGLANLRTIRERTGTRIDLMSMCIAAKQVVEVFPEHVELMGKCGVKLHMLQPFLMTKGNTRSARTYMTSWDRIEWAVREGAKVARRHGGRIKLFNTPVCSFWDIAPDLERQHRELDVFREHESRRPEATQRTTTHGYYRIEACATCDEPCPGFRAEYYPQERMIADLRGAVDRHIVEHGAGELWLGGLELLAPDSLREVMAHARARSGGRLVMLTAGIGRSHYEQFARPIVELVDEIAFVLHPPRADARTYGDRHTAHGNLDDVASGLEAVRGLRLGTRISATFSAEQLDGAPDLPGRLEGWGVRSVALFARPEGNGGRPWWEHPGRTRGLRELVARGIGVSLLGRTAAPNDEPPIVDPTPRLVRHPWTGRDAEWINWSVPWWVHFEELLGATSARRALPLVPSGAPAPSIDDR